jgi:hypothetical protein
MCEGLGLAGVFPFSPRDPQRLFPAAEGLSHP